MPKILIITLWNTPQCGMQNLFVFESSMDNPYIVKFYGNSILSQLI